jgi:GTP-binding protein
MVIKSATYTSSYVDQRKCPKADLPEYAFIGRSNVGKSSLINMLTDHKHLAKTSGQPGKTQTINFFLINQQWNIADLPGFGYAKVSKSSRKEWEKMIRDYLVKREQLRCVFLLIDCNIPPQKIDIEFINWLGESAVPFVLTFTKADRNNATIVKANIAAFQNKMLESWEELPQSFVTSAKSGEGKEDIMAFIKKTNGL